MAGEQLILDPTSEDASNTQLDITSSALGYFLLGHDYPTPENDEVWAYSADTEGEQRANTRRKNRTITVKVRCIEPSGGTPSIGTIVSNLQRKVGKLNAEGGTYKRVLPSGDEIVFTVRSATIQVPADKQWITLKKADVDLVFTCAPLGLGPLQTLGTHTATAKAPLVFTETGIKGDVTATASLRIGNATNAKTWVTWGQQSRYYDAAAGAALLLEAETGQAGFAAANAGPTGASGGGSNKVMRHTSVGTLGANSYGIKPAGVNLAHVGTFVALARVQAATANTGVVSIQLSWRQRLGNPVIDNDWVAIADTSGVPINGSWVIANLGMISIPKARIGTQSWDGNLTAKSTVSSDQIDYDWIALIPVDEGSGILKTPDIPISSSSLVDISDQEAILSNNGSNWFDPSKSYEGDFLGGRTGVPPAGAEGRTLRMIVIVAGATTAGNVSDTIIDAVNLDAITATLSYRPRYLAVPAP